MNTFWHFFWTYILFRKKKYVNKTLLFSFAPDLPWFISNIIAFLMVGFGPNSYKLAWENQYVILASTFMNSFIVILAFYIILKFLKPSFLPITYAWAFHAVLDFLTHHEDAYPVLWPFTDWKFHSPISYWQQNHHSIEFAILNLILVSIAVIFLIKNKTKSKNIQKRDRIISVIMIIGLLLSTITVAYWVNNIYSLRFFFILILNIIPLTLFTYLYLKLFKQNKTTKHHA